MGGEGILKRQFAYARSSGAFSLFFFLANLTSAFLFFRVQLKNIFLQPTALCLTNLKKYIHNNNIKNFPILPCATIQVILYLDNMSRLYEKTNMKKAWQEKFNSLLLCRVVIFPFFPVVQVCYFLLLSSGKVSAAFSALHSRLACRMSYGVWRCRVLRW